MNTHKRRRSSTLVARGLLVCLLGYAGISAAAAITEAESNDSISTPQPVSVPPEGVTISGAVGQDDEDVTTDVDYYSFKATQGNTPSITIVGALQRDANGDCAGFPSVLTLYDAAGNVLAGSLADCESGTEARIDNTTLLETGTYIVSVSGYPHFGDTGGDVQNMEFATPGGDYQLVISGVQDPTPAPAENPPPPPPPVQSPSAKHVPIEVRHWHQDERDLGRRRGMDPIAVAIMSIAGFDATTVDQNSLTFGAVGNESSLFRCRKNGVDINRDGKADMVCYFKPDVANFKIGDRNGVLKGKTKSGEQIEGSAALKIFSVPSELRGFKHRNHRGMKKRRH